MQQLVLHSTARFTEFWSNGAMAEYYAVQTAVPCYLLICCMYMIYSTALHFRNTLS